MTPTLRLTRRVMLRALALAGLSATPLAALATTLHPAERLRRLLPHPESAQAVGLIYRAAFPAEVRSTVLVPLLLSSLSLDAGAVAGRSDASLRRAVAARVRADFAAGETVEIGGWMLSRTEARLCALWA
jgi:hypothetical protein